MEEGDQQPMNASRLETLEKVKKPLELLKAHNPVDTLILAPSEVNSTSDFGLPELEYM